MRLYGGKPQRVFKKREENEIKEMRKKLVKKKNKTKLKTSKSKIQKINENNRKVRLLTEKVLTKKH